MTISVQQLHGDTACCVAASTPTAPVSLCARQTCVWESVGKGGVKVRGVFLHSPRLSGPIGVPAVTPAGPPGPGSRSMQIHQSLFTLNEHVSSCRR